MKQILISLASLFAIFSFTFSNASPWPVANSDSAEVPKNGSVTIHVLENDSGSGLSIASIDSWSVNGGQSTVNASNTSITYTPPPNYIGQDSFWYDFVDDQGRTNAAAVNITVVESTNPPPPSDDVWPTATPDSATTDENTPVSIHVLANDIGTGLIITFVDNWTENSGQASINITSNTISYTPASDFTGVDSFWYEFVDNQGRTNAAKVSVTVTESNTPPPPPPPSNSWPTATPDTATVLQNQSIDIPVLINDVGVGLRLKSIDTWTVKAGRAYIDPTKSFVTYVPASNFTGSDSFWYEFEDNQQRTNAAEVIITVTQNSTPSFSHVPMHYNLLKNQAIIWGEVGSQPPYSEAIQNIRLTSSASKGDTSLGVANNSGLMVGQLIVYLATDGDFYVTKIHSLSGHHTINLVEPLEAPVTNGTKAWNFYADPSHPNRYGYRAIADFSFRNLNMGINTSGRHVLLGDSWFDNDGISTSRFIQKLPNATIFNEGTGGNTCQDLINRFDYDVTPYSPDYVWIICGTNDYWQGVSTSDYKSNLETLINKIKAIGAEAIIIDSSVGSGVGASGVPNFQQSEEYANAVIQLLRED